VRFIILVLLLSTADVLGSLISCLPSPVMDGPAQATTPLADEEVFMKDIPADPVQFEQHIQRLMDKRLDENDPSLNGFDEEFLFIEMKTGQANVDPSNFVSALYPGNRIKNRYSNVLPPESTRVKLCELKGVEGSDYINANFINGLVPGSEKRYVATQGPLTATLGDFWRMVWELQSVVIVMLTKEVENGRNKCDRYWPSDDGEVVFDSFQVSLVEIGGTEELTERKLKIVNTETAGSRFVYQFQYTAWPDHGLPESTHAFLDLAHKVDQVNALNAPIIVHCSAGIGRSGTFCTVHATIEKLRQDVQDHPQQQLYVNIVKTILYMRQQRPGMVQTKDQYVFCYLTILEETQRLFGVKNVKNGIETAPGHHSYSNNSENAGKKPAMAEKNLIDFD